MSFTLVHKSKQATLSCVLDKSKERRSKDYGNCKEGSGQESCTCKEGSSQKGCACKESSGQKEWREEEIRF
jgi:hypothetical protein